MSNTQRVIISFTVMACLLLIVGFFQSWSLMLSILNLCLISSVMALGVNIQWGYAGLFNVGTMGFAALGGVARCAGSSPLGLAVVATLAIKRFPSFAIGHADASRCSAQR